MRMRLAIARSRPWNAQCYLRSNAHLARDVEPAAVIFGDAADDRQTKTAAAAFGAATSHKPAKHVGDLALWYANAGVDDFEADFLPNRDRADRNPRRTS